jgi:A/G-specific adenine glycosylase
MPVPTRFRWPDASVCASASSSAFVGALSRLATAGAPLARRAITAARGRATSTLEPPGLSGPALRKPPQVAAPLDESVDAAGTAAARPHTLACVEELLLAWFSENARPLPWRATRDPYAILVSECMAQQTQVERVVPRWQRWLLRWPDAEALAAAPTGEVIREWQGLGYNRRALALHRAARQVAAHGWPDDLTDLPGVGRYTADAVACFAFGRPVLPVDVNVRRVLQRTGFAFGPECAQALMDLGATVCIARVPRCGECPLAAGCPSRGRRFEPSRRQGPFEGSFRQRRAAALHALLDGDEPSDGEALVSLARDGLVLLEDGVPSLPH